MTLSKDGLLASTLAHLQGLVSCDTTNPPRAIAPEDRLFTLIQEALGDDFSVDVQDLGEGRILYYVERHCDRSTRPLLVNVHLDTVPVTAGWSDDPFLLRIQGDRAIGLGACDIKGAAACWLTAVGAVPDAPIAMLFTTDEEAGKSDCVKKFIASAPREYELVLVAEPTDGKAVGGHRGIRTGSTTFLGRSGHASTARAAADNALHHMSDWLARVFEGIEEFGGASAVRFNLGRIEGGIKPNIVASEAFVRWGFRPGWNDDVDAILSRIEIKDPAWSVAHESGFSAPTLPSEYGGTSAQDRRQRALRKATELGMQEGRDVDFWTEAALFSLAGFDTVVFGPGDIEQAHTKDEYVLLDSLENTVQQCVTILEKVRR